MIKIGKRQSMKINNFSSKGLYLDAGTGETQDNILLPNNEIEGRELQPGDDLDVMIYRDSEDRLIATLRKTHLTVGTIGKLVVTDVNEKLGAFLDWGLKKELLLPYAQMEGKVRTGDEVLVGLYEDSRGRLSTTMKIYSFLMPNKDYQKNDSVEGTVYRINPEIGVFVAVDDRYFGLIPSSECFRDFEVGEKISARVIRVREDGKLDLALRDLAFMQMDKDGQVIVAKMKVLKTYFRFNDSSSPETIKEYFGISKKAFKRAMGRLLKEEIIEKTEEGYFKLK
ncbi:S1-like domain-containing RNA-binding protein [uncultured Cetobacterium sp.]|uniref:CvfB family protein n=1 Tax=uncultured Cetobacterium sp. TaxID=527638 RepID=UPI00260689C3|nr:S1-like domain-containing RNA-binding protein [uncultured Cetobacterium sp.]